MILFYKNLCNLLIFMVIHIQCANILIFIVIHSQCDTETNKNLEIFSIFLAHLSTK